MLQAPKAGMLPLLSDDELIWVIAPSGRNVRHVISFIGAHPELRWQVVITSPAHLRRFVRRHADHALGEQAADWLRDRYPVCSAAASMPRRWILSAAIAAAAIFGLVMAPAASLIALQVAVSVVFLAWTGLRVMGMLLPPAAAAKPLRLDEAALPVYTIIVALYREATAVPGLIESLRALEYPLEKLDVKLVLEADDPQTRLAVAAMELRPPFEVMFAPDVGPRTKPKALNAALAFARGEFTVIFDAEDRPQPGQLREALTAFQADRTGELACVQARLAIDNTSDSWLAALFAAEYAGQFDVLLPGLASLNLPLPLGGSSNHFRTSILRQAGAWDAYNVTEDADLGTRLARLGYRTGVIASTTQEEAPTHFEPWLKQRTRWLKGWMQTWQVHMRQPWRLVRDLGIAGFTTFQLMLIGTVLAALLQPIVVGFIIAGSLIELAAIVPAGVNDWPILGALHWSALAAGYLASVALALAGLVRRRLRWIIWLLPLMLVHWAFLSIAAWRALHQLCRDPYRWEKTEHRLGRRPRRS
jgi:cellulose synthase/poly-beta-1,6-N-acetylglucosamine synthase-like glycosyltransferase